MSDALREMTISFYASLQDVDSQEKTYIRDVEGPNWSQGNARLLLQLLGLKFDESSLCGQASLPEARRAVIRGVNIARTSLQKYVRPAEQLSDRAFVCGLDEEGIKYRIIAFADFVDDATIAEAKSIYWG